MASRARVLFHPHRGQESALNRSALQSLRSRADLRNFPALPANSSVSRVRGGRRGAGSGETILQLDQSTLRRPQELAIVLSRWFFIEIESPHNPNRGKQFQLVLRLKNSYLEHISPNAKESMWESFSLGMFRHLPSSANLETMIRRRIEEANKIRYNRLDRIRFEKGFGMVQDSAGLPSDSITSGAELAESTVLWSGAELVFFYSAEDRRGGCMTSKAQAARRVQLGDKWFNLISFRSEDNRCLEAAVVGMMKKLSIEPPKTRVGKNIRSKSMKVQSVSKELFGEEESKQRKNFDHLKKLVQHYKLDVLGYDCSGSIVRDLRYADHVPSRALSVILLDDHWYAVESTVDIVEGSFQSRVNAGDVEELDRIRASKKREIESTVDLESNVDEAFLALPKSVQYDVIVSEALDVIFEQKKHLCIFGPAGCGKSSLIQKIKDHKKSRDVALCATSGCAAELIGGETLNSYCGVGIETSADGMISRVAKNKSATARIKNMKVLLIEEVSMLGAKFFDALEQLFRKVRALPDQFFGGVRLVLVGDPVQLPPVSDHFFFLGSAWRTLEESQHEIFVLSHSFRFDKCPALASLVSEMRYLRNGDSMSVHSKTLLSSRVFSAEEIHDRLRSTGQDTIWLASTKSEVHEQNEQYLNGLAGEEKTFKDGLRVKVGALVMCLTNRFKSQCGLVNGSTGTVSSIDVDSVTVVWSNGCTRQMGRIQIDGKTRWSIMVAKSMTIHKAQGCTLRDVNVCLNLRSVFSAGQVYVAISRCTVLSQLFLLSNMKPGSVYSSAQALDFEKHCLLREVYHFRTTNHRDTDGREESVAITFKLHRKPLRQSLKHAILFDLETVPGETECHATYYGFGKVYEGGVATSTIEEMYEAGNERSCGERFFSKMMDVIDKHKQKATNMIKFNKETSPLIIGAYNGSGFDFAFFLKYLMSQSNRGYEVIPLEQKNRVLSITLKFGSCIVAKFHDICLILKDSLNRSAKAWLALNIQKDFFPHGFMARMRSNLDEVFSSETVEVKMEDFNIADRDEIQKEVAEGKLDLENYPISQIIRTYCQKDVDILEALYVKLDDVIASASEDNKGASICDFITATQMTAYKFKASLPADMYRGEYDEKGDGKKIQKKLTKLDFLTEEKAAFVERAVYGGRTLPRVFEFQSSDFEPACDAYKNYRDVNDYVIDLDVSGMYAQCMLEGIFPYGKGEFANEERLQRMEQLCSKGPEGAEDFRAWCEQNTHIGYWQCTVEPDKNDVEACLPRRMYAANGKKGKLIWDLNDRTAVYYYLDLYIALKNNAKIHSFTTGLVFEECGPIFKEYMEKCTQGKLEANKAGNKSLESFYKLQSNAIYGWALMAVTNQLTLFLKGDPDVHSFVENYDFTKVHNLAAFTQGLEELLIVTATPQTDSNSLRRNVSYIGAAVLSYSRLMLDSLFTVLYPNRRKPDYELQIPLYGDTDSLFVRSERVSALSDVAYDSIIGHKTPGKFGDDTNKNALIKIIDGEAVLLSRHEHEFAKIIRASFYRAKEVALVFVMPPNTKADNAKLLATTPDGSTVWEKLYCKGISFGNCTFFEEEGKLTTRELNFEQLRSVGRGEKQLVSVKDLQLKKVGKNVPQKYRDLDISSFSIVQEYGSRTMGKSKWTGRAVYKGVSTLPHGHAALSLN